MRLVIHCGMIALVACTLLGLSCRADPVSRPTAGVGDAPRTFVIKLNGNGGKGGTTSVKVASGGVLPKIVPPTSGGWCFDGYWTTVRPGGVQYYGADGTGVRAWDRGDGVTLWAKWTCLVKLGKNSGKGGGGGYVIATRGQPIPNVVPPKKPGYAFGGYWTSPSKLIGKWINADGTATDARWMNGGTPSIYALWTYDCAGLVMDIVAFALIISFILFLSRTGNAFCFAALLGVAMLLTFPPPVAVTLPGLDPTYQWLVNQFAFTNVWGNDVVFTYGPLGFLVEPQLALANVLCGIAFNAMCAGVFAYVAVSLFRAGRGTPARAVAWMLLALAVCPWTGESMEWKWGFLSILSVGVVVFDGVRARWGRLFLLAFAAFLAVVLSLTKFSLFFTVVPQHVALLGWQLLRSRGRAWRAVAVYCGAAALAVGLAIALLFPSFQSFVLWARGSYEMSYGYGHYMTCEKSTFELVCPFALSACVAVGLLWRNPKRGAALLYALLYAPALFCAYKYAVIRHPNGIAPFAHLLAGACMLLPLAMRADVKRGALLAALAISTSALSTCIYSPGLLTSSISVKNLFASVRPGRSLQEAAEQSKVELRGVGLPSEWKDRIGTNSVMVAGSDYGIVMEGNLRLRPLPALQLYSAYTRYLDGLCADSLRPRTRSGDWDPPRFLILPGFPLSIDGRNTYLDNPAFWREVRRHYAVVESGFTHFLLERRAVPVEPDAHTPSFRVELEPSLAGRICSFLFRPTRLSLEVTYQNGRVRTFSYNPLWANAEPQVMSIPATPEEVFAFLGGAGTAVKVSSLRILANAPWCYRSLGVRVFDAAMEKDRPSKGQD